VSSKKKTAAPRSKQSRENKLLPDISDEDASNGSSRECRQIKSPQTGEEREKWLAKRDALTLRAFQIAYKNHHQRKSS
jgi:hypothetical protein